MRYLITGGSGYVGSHLVSTLLSQGHEIIITGTNNEQRAQASCISYTFHDLDWNSIFPIDVVFHQAAITNTRHETDSDFYLVNFEYSKKLFQDAVHFGCKKIIYASSCAVYGNNLTPPFAEEDASKSEPLNAYGHSKFLLDQWTMNWSLTEGITVIGLRYSNIYGAGENHKGKSASMIYQLIQQMLAGNPKLFKWGEQKRDFVHIDDVIRANILATHLNKSDIFNVGSGIATSFNELVELLNRLLGLNRQIEYFDNSLVGYQSFTQCDMSKSKDILEFIPLVDLEQGIIRYIILEVVKNKLSQM